MLSEIIQHIRGALESVGQMRMPTTVRFDYPKFHPLAGEPAVQMTLVRDANGARYTEASLGDRPPHAVVSPLRIDHEIHDLDDFARYVSADDSFGQGFVIALPFVAALIVAVDEARPERGSVTMEVKRHPAWARWASVAGTGTHRDLSHGELADLVLDNRPDLAEPALADVLAQFRSAREVVYDADLGSTGYSGVKVIWKGRGGQQGAATDVAIPDEFEAMVPAYTGAWPAGEEPRHKATFRLRVLPPQDDSAPLFRILWVNAVDFELEAANALVLQVRGLVDALPVYRGTPSSTHVMLPGKVG